MNDYEILVNLSESEERRMRMSDLASATLQSKSRLSHQITRMENAGSGPPRELRVGPPRAVRGPHRAGLGHHAKVAPHHVASVRKHFIDLLLPEPTWRRCTGR